MYRGVPSDLVKKINDTISNPKNGMSRGELEKAVKSYSKEYDPLMGGLVYQVIKVCSADGHFAPEELKIVSSIAEWVNMPKQSLEAIKALCKAEIEHKKQLKKLCFN